MIFKKPVFDFIVAGLGNPGRQYESSRHNAGFKALESLAFTLNVKIVKSRFDALCGEAKLKTGERLLLLKPQTFMNLSGRSLKKAADFYKLPPEKIIVVFDDVSLPVGKMRIRPQGSAGGHNGIKSIISELGTDVFPRLKLGVGANEYDDMKDWVLGGFTPDEAKTMAEVYKNAPAAILSIVTEGDDPRTL